MDAVVGEVTELLQHLIRNRCVNDGTPASGHEDRSAALLRDYFDGSGLDLSTYEPTPGRTSLVARIEGHDPDAPSVCLMGHTDVVPVTAEQWSRDPFGGELVAGEVWGRGAIDMLNLTASMAVATRHLAVEGFRPEGTLIYLAVADEESGGHHGAGWLAEHAWDAVGADYVLTESGGILTPTPTGPKVTVTVAEKGVAWRRLRVRGTPAHGSMPFGADNAIIKAAEIVRRLAAFRPRAEIGELWRTYVANNVVDQELRAALLDPERIWAACQACDDARMAKFWHACTHATFSPNVVHGGIKTNVIPDVVDLDVDIRALPGQTPEDVNRLLDEALGDLAGEVEVTSLQNVTSTASPAGTPLWEVLERLAAAVYPGATLLPRITVGGTDAGYFRRRGAVAYGCGLMSREVTYEQFANRFHGNDERIDVASLGLTTDLWFGVAREFLGR
ncbi:MAG TPA: M20/M25/M40 family metallo-hydrolase [Acidimicrobiales bacterium]|nr:M20/M25/M40 family metallo-hydrolase [Acidimicrobiales bacterium]